MLVKLENATKKLCVIGDPVLHTRSPLLQNAIVDLKGGEGYLASYWLIIAALAYLLFYAVIGSKNVNKDIPVE